MPARILVVEDEAPIRELLVMVLERVGFDVDAVGNTSDAFDKAIDTQPNLILLDWLLPGESGVAFAKRLKQKSSPATRDIPIIMLTARGEEDDKVYGLEAGADDYITKPFAPKELVARVRAVLRRVAPMTEEAPLEVNGLVLDPVARSVMANGAKIDLGPTEYNLLHFFMAHQERVYSRSRLLDNVWGVNVYVEERTVDVHIRRLRKALTGTGFEQYIQTVRGAGYRFSDKV